MTASMYPLQWPEGWARTENYKRKSPRYKVNMARAVSELQYSMEHLGALKGSIVISSNVPPRNGLGTPKNDGVYAEDPGVSVWWTTKAHGERVIACDKWNTVLGNVRAVGLAAEALRQLDRAGASQILERAFTAFGELPAAGTPVKKPWWEVLGFDHSMIGMLSKAVVEARYRELAKKVHPDVNGGNAAAMTELTEAKEAGVTHYGG